MYKYKISKHIQQTMKRGAEQLEDGEIGAGSPKQNSNASHAAAKTPPTPVHKKKKLKKLLASQSRDVIQSVYGDQVG